MSTSAADRHYSENDRLLAAARALALAQRSGQAPPTLLTLPQPLLVLQPFEFGRRARGKDAKREQVARLGGHWPLVENRQVAEMLTLRVAEWYA
jgi:hypothetical protein